MFFIDPVQSELPSILSDVIKNPLEIVIFTSILAAGGFSSSVGSVSSSYPGKTPINVYLTTAPTTLAVNEQSDSITFACPAPTTAGGLKTYPVNMLNQSDYEISLYIEPCLSGGQNTGILSNSNPISIGPGENDFYNLINTATSTDNLSVKITLTSPQPILRI
jgi:hypothetical protein